MVVEGRTTANVFCFVFCYFLDKLKINKKIAILAKTLVKSLKQQLFRNIQFFPEIFQSAQINYLPEKGIFRDTPTKQQQKNV